MTLLLYLLTTRMISDSGGDIALCSSVAPSGTTAFAHTAGEAPAHLLPQRREHAMDIVAGFRHDTIEIVIATVNAVMTAENTIF